MLRLHSALGTAVAAGVLAFGLSAGTASAQDVVLRGATQFDDSHAFNRTLHRFAELTNEYWEGGTVEFLLQGNSELGIERDYLNLMSRGISVDYAIVAPSNAANFSPMAPLMDMPFLFRDLDHWNAVLASDAFGPIEDEILANARSHVIGYAGGGTRNLISTYAIDDMATLEAFSMRVQGAPIQAQIFDAIGAAPSVIAYNEVYNAIQTGVIDGLENEAAGIQQMRFYEVAPHIPQTMHTITVRPILFSDATFQSLPEDLQAAILRAGREAGEYGRQLESSEDEALMAQMESEGLIEIHPFADRDALLELAAPVQDEYATELGATEILEAVRNM